MRWQRLSGLLVVLLAVVAMKLGHEAYRWFAYADERAELREMTERLEGAALEVVISQLATDSMRASIEAADSRLGELRERVDEFEKWSHRGTLPEHLHRRYRMELDRYNAQVAERNSRLDRWEEVVGRNHSAVAHYNRLADSVRLVAARMGEPFYPVPSPVEVAIRRGLLDPVD
jgi:hypothetical protein